VLFDDAEAGTLTPAPTPDGENILFGTRAASGDITWRVVPVNGGPATIVAAPPGVDQPRWSPDGSAIAWFTSDGTGSIGLSSPGSTAFVAVSPAGWTVNNRMSWAPYNTELAIERRLTGGDTDLYILTVAGATLPLSVGEHLDYGPGWSPDGHVVAFLRNDLADATSGIYTVRGDGSELHQVAVGRFFSEVHWSPDGRTLATSRFAGPGGDYQLVTVDVETGVVTPAFAPSALWEYYANPWAPGARALLETDRNAGDGYAVITNDGPGSRQQVSPDSVSATSPAWIPE
jgi:Tol biopolymer transport system component